MDVIVRGKHFEVPEAVAERARRKLDQLVHYLPALADASAEVDLAHEKAKEPGQRYISHITLSAHGIHLQTEERAASPEAAVDLAAQVLTRQARREKDRLYSRSRQRGVKQFEAQAPARKQEDGESLVLSKIARVKHIPIKPMTTEEAVAQMELLGHDFFLFHDADVDQVALLYRREAGDYGLIIPEPS